MEIWIYREMEVYYIYYIKRDIYLTPRLEVDLFRVQRANYAIGPFRILCQSYLGVRNLYYKSRPTGPRIVLNRYFIVCINCLAGFLSDKDKRFLYPRLQRKRFIELCSVRQLFLFCGIKSRLFFHHGCWPRVPAVSQVERKTTWFHAIGELRRARGVLNYLIRLERVTTPLYIYVNIYTVE